MANINSRPLLEFPRPLGNNSLGIFPRAFCLCRLVFTCQSPFFSPCPSIPLFSLLLPAVYTATKIPSLDKDPGLSTFRDGHIHIASTRDEAAPSSRASRPAAQHNRAAQRLSSHASTARDSAAHCRSPARRGQSSLGSHLQNFVVEMEAHILEPRYTAASTRAVGTRNPRGVLLLEVR